MGSRREWSSRRRPCSCGRPRGLGCNLRRRKSVTSRARSSGRRRRSPARATTRRPPRRRAVRPPGGAAVLADLFTRYETVKRAAGACDFEDILLLTCAVLEENPEVARQVQRPLPQLRRGRIPGRHPAATAASRRVARWPRQPVRRRRRRSDDLQLHRGVPPLPARVPGPLPRRRCRAPGPQLPQHARGRSAREPGAGGGVDGGAGAVAAGRAMPLRTGPGLHRMRRRAGGGGHACARGIRRLVDAGTPAREIAVLVPDQRPVCGVRVGAYRAARPVPRARARRASSNAPRCGRRWSRCGELPSPGTPTGRPAWPSR